MIGVVSSLFGRAVAVAALSLLVAAPLQCETDPGPGNPPITQPPTTQPPILPPTTQPPAIPAQCRAGFGAGARVQIVGGYQSPDGCRTYQVALLESRRQICGGTLIADQWVLTAAHCVTAGANTFDMSVALGGQTLSNFNGEIIQVTEVIVHPQYNPNFLSFDVALLRLASPANPAYTRALLPDPTVDMALASTGNSLLSTGWGVTQSGGQASSDELLEVLMPISDLQACSSLPITGREICSAGFGQSTCFGDSGGPLAGILNEEIYVLGVVSYGDENCSVTSVYARVASYQAWIINTLFSRG